MSLSGAALEAVAYGDAARAANPNEFLDAALQTLELQRTAYDALHQIIFAAWYGNPRSWPAIGYAGPPELFS